MQEPVVNTESILESVKKILGLTKEYDAFDADITIHINTVFSTLTQMGVGPSEGFQITGYESKWSEFITKSGPTKTAMVKSYIPMKVKTLFDPPSNGNLMAALNKAISEMEYRLYTEEGGY